MMEDYEAIQKLADDDVKMLRIKGEGYGRSWVKRGGVGAFMMAARKWDRIENMAQKRGFDILAAGEDGVMEDIADLRAYLLLIENEFRRRPRDITPL